MSQFNLDSITRRLERAAQRIEKMRLGDYLCYVHNWRKRICFEFMIGIVRGLGFSIGFSVLGALLLYLLRNIALANLPIIGRFLAELVRIVEENL